jgi:lipoprotein NlpD
MSSMLPGHYHILGKRIMTRLTWSIVATLVMFLTGCGERASLAPVVDSRWTAQNTNQAIHRVQRGETLYAIAFRYDKDYQKLADYNHLRSPYAIRVGQILRLQYSYRAQKPTNKAWASYSSGRTMPSPKSSSYSSLQSTKVATAPQFSNNVNWSWPLRGRVVTYFIPSQGKKGIDIASKKGEVVYASAPGVVAYAGSGLRGYGNLIIIKHNSQYLTAYGNNARNLVHEGEHISAGQRIAEVGVIDRRFWGVHFEIRQAGQPVNPLNYLMRGNGMK